MILPKGNFTNTPSPYVSFPNNLQLKVAGACLRDSLTEYSLHHHERTLYPLCMHYLIHVSGTGTTKNGKAGQTSQALGNDGRHVGR